MKKRTVALLLALMLVFGCAVGGTVAWLTGSTTTVTNTFTTGNVKITLDETDVDNSTDGAERDTANEYEVVPGGTYAKDPIIHVDEDSENCYIYVTVSNGLGELEAATGNGYTNIEDQMTANGWFKLEGETVDGVQVWYYKGNLADANGAVSAETDIPVFQEFKINGAKLNAETDLSNVKVVVNAYAIQSENVGTITEAWASGGWN